MLHVENNTYTAENSTAMLFVLFSPKIVLHKIITYNCSKKAKLAMA
jgi:hypothetical protein